MFDKDKKKELTKSIREWNNLREKIMDKMDLMTPEERADLLDQLKEKLGKIRKEINQNDSEGDHFPYPYIFKPPKPPDDLAMTPQVQVHAPPKDENPDDERVCQFCGLKLTEEEQHTHSCKKKPE